MGRWGIRLLKKATTMGKYTDSNHCTCYNTNHRESTSWTIFTRNNAPRTINTTTDPSNLLLTQKTTYATHRADWHMTR